MKREVSMKIVVTADPCAVPLKKTVIKYLESLGHTVYECGSTEEKEVPYFWLLFKTMY